MEQKARVRQVNPDGTAQVLCIRESACSGDCHHCSGCGAAKETLLFDAENPVGAATGDLVRVESQSGPVLKAAMVLYVLPLVLFFLGYFLGEGFGCGALAACLCFCLGIALAVLYDRKVVRPANTTYTITAVIEKKSYGSARNGDTNHG